MTKIAIVGEAWGADEERERTAFVGVSGWALTQMLSEAGIARADCFLTNVFNFRPSNNKLEALCGPKSDAIPGYPAIFKGKHIRKDYESELHRLGGELVDVDPNVVIALGNTAAWALLGKTAVSKLRGVTYLSTHTASGFKVIPTYHPAAVLRQWELRPVTVMDLCKARREQEFPEIRRPKREIWIEPSLEDLETFYKQHIESCSILSLDIETAGEQMTCIGFAPKANLGLVIPFVDPRKKGRSYWPTKEQELYAWAFVKRVLTSDIPKVGQNIIFDVSFLWRAYGLKTMNVQHDDMLLHHALQPESLKALGFLGSCYTSEGPWKSEHRFSKTVKRDD